MNVSPLDRIFDLGLGNRAINCLKNDNITYIGDLVQKSASELRRTPNLGIATVAEIEAALAPHGLRLGAPLPNWPEEHTHALAA